MNRKNLTAAVLAGLAGAAGIAGTAQAVNINPDGLGSVLIYPYYTSNGGNQTIMSVVNTTENAKAVKVRFLEGYNSREVLDFNMYMSAYDVWVAGIADNAGTPTLYVPDSTCTVPYLFEQDSDGDGVGEQEFLPYAYTGTNSDGGPSDIARAAEGHFEMIEMGTLTNETATAKVLGSAEAATHVLTDDGPRPLDCQQLVDNWTGFAAGADGMWYAESQVNGGTGSSDIDRSSGGLFGGAAVVNSANGTMYSYDPKAIQGFDDTDHDLHFRPGNERPSLNSGSRKDATIFFGEPLAKARTYNYARGVDAVSAVFMHENIMNTWNIDTNLNAMTEWVVTFPTKNFYVDVTRNLTQQPYWIPDPSDPGCNGWDPGEPYPTWAPGLPKAPGWEQCTYLKITGYEIRPFTSLFDGEACELADIRIWDREEIPQGLGPDDPPIVSPPPPGGGSSSSFELCYEVNVMRFADTAVPDTGTEIFGSPASTVRNVDVTGLNFDGTTPVAGWANINFHYLTSVTTSGGKVTGIPAHRDWNGLVGLPVTGFNAEQFENGFLGVPGATVLANYGGLFQHKANVRRQACPDNPLSIAPSLCGS